MSAKVKNGKVVLEMSQDQYDSLMVMLGMAVAWGFQQAPEQGRQMAAFVDALNEGHPQYRPYVETL